MAQLLPFDRLVVIDKSADTAVYLQVANALMHHIRTGVLRPGLQLPGTRELAAELGLNRNTIKAALEELQAQGWIEAMPRKGNFVAADLPKVRPGRIERPRETAKKKTTTGGQTAGDDVARGPAGGANFDMWYRDDDPLRDRPRHKGNIFIDDGFPDIRLAPMDLFLREVRSLSGLSSFQKYLQYGSAAGTDYMLDTLKTYLNDTRGLHVNKERLMITRGVQNATYLAASILLKPGAQVIVGEPGYAYANKTFEKLGAVLNRVMVDDQGIDVDAVAALCRKKKVALLYVMPHHHSPTTVRLCPQRRIQLLELAKRYRFAILEDDYDYDFHYDSSPVLPMASLDHSGNVIYVGTFSKTIAPAVRIGFMTGPEDLSVLPPNDGC